MFFFVYRELAIPRTPMGRVPRSQSKSLQSAEKLELLRWRLLAGDDLVAECGERVGEV
jgi:hypothetical protein